MPQDVDLDATEEMSEEEEGDEGPRPHLRLAATHLNDADKPQKWIQCSKCEKWRQVGRPPPKKFPFFFACFCFALLWKRMTVTTPHSPGDVVMRSRRLCSRIHLLGSP